MRTENHILVLPDLLKLCPWKTSLNQNYERAKKESATWVNGFGFFEGEQQKCFVESYNELLMAYVYPDATYDDFRTVCDFVNILFVIDAITDEQGSQDVIATKDIVIQALNKELRGGPAIVRLINEWMDRFDRKHLPGNRRRFVRAFEGFLNDIAREAKARETGQILSIREYVAARRDNSAILTLFALGEYIHGVDLPESVFADPAVLRCHFAAADMVGFSNDLYSYKMELDHGLDYNNLLTVIMHEKNCTLQQAANDVGRRFHALLDEYLKCKAQIPSFIGDSCNEKVDEGVKAYLQTLEDWISGNLIWSFESLRYFGKRHKEVQQTLVVRLK